VRALLVVGGHVAAVEAGHRRDPVRERARGPQSDAAAHAVAGDADLLALHRGSFASQSRQAFTSVICRPAPVGAAQLLELRHRLGIAAARALMSGGSYGPGAPEHVRQDHVVAGLRQPLAHLEHRRADRRRVHDQDRPRPRPGARVRA
jgi:hypothetical protein